MTPPMTLTVPMTAQGTIAFACPQCGDARTASVMSFQDRHAPIGVECDCGHFFDILIETRQERRQDINLPGTYTPVGSSIALSMTVNNLSASGIGFCMVQPCDLKVGDKLELCYEFDDANRTPIHALAIVRWVEEGVVGARFYDPSADQATRVLNIEGLT